MEDGREAVMGAAGEKGSAERSYEKVRGVATATRKRITRTPPACLALCASRVCPCFLVHLIHTIAGEYSYRCRGRRAVQLRGLTVSSYVSDPAPKIRDFSPGSCPCSPVLPVPHSEETRRG